ncbi:unnamed protein product [Mytilus coruscus]|uniref:Uncharacterized protein n=1 Tax=Mytilus coruscus TaxID=42192 RepID=A0A6J8CR28_MYTCO|nr:unnamed protein product [Mytilus coruscus]
MPRRGIKRTNNSNSYSNTSDNNAFDESVEKKPSKKKSKQRNKNKSSNVNKGEHKSEHLNGSGDFRNVNNQTSSTVDNVNLMSSFNQPRYVNDTNLMYSQNPSPMFQMQNQSQHLCSTPNPGMMSFSIHQVHHTSPLAQQIPDQRPGWVDELFRKMDNFEIKLCKLDQIDSLVTSINSKVIKLEQNAKSIDHRMDQVERSSQLISNDFDTQKVVFSKFKTELDNISKQIKLEGTHSVDRLGETLDDIRKENTKLKSELIDVQMRSMRNNLIFYNIPESEGEHCSQIINKFCYESLKIENVATKLSIAEAYRLGKHGEKTRPILVKLSNFESRDLVKKSAKNSKETVFGISEQLPLDIQKRRKEKLPILKNLRERDIKAYFVKDRTFVNGKEYLP